MEKNKNLIIAALAGLLIIGSLWGSIGNKSAKVLKEELRETVTELEEVRIQNRRQHDQVLGKTAELQEKAKNLDQQLAQARKELVGLRKANKGLEAQLSERDAERKDLTARLKKAKASIAQKGGETAMQELVALQEEVAALREELAAKDEQLAAATPVAEGAGSDGEKGAESDAVAVQFSELEEKLAAAETALEKMRKQMNGAEMENKHAMARLTRQFETERAQVIGLEKIVEEKNDVINETSRELDRIQINMDVLLAKIADQQDALQEREEESRELIKSLAAKNETIADLQEQLQLTPVE